MTELTVLTASGAVGRVKYPRHRTRDPRASSPRRTEQSACPLPAIPWPPCLWSGLHALTQCVPFCGQRCGRSFLTVGTGLLPVWRGPHQQCWLAVVAPASGRPTSGPPCWLPVAPPPCRPRGPQVFCATVLRVSGVGSHDDFDLLCGSLPSVTRSISSCACQPFAYLCRNVCSSLCLFFN